jgi:hypothetical protein
MEVPLQIYLLDFTLYHQTYMPILGARAKQQGSQAHMWSMVFVFGFGPRVEM